MSQLGVGSGNKLQRQKKGPWLELRKKKEVREMHLREGGGEECRCDPQGKLPISLYFYNFFLEYILSR